MMTMAPHPISAIGGRMPFSRMYLGQTMSFASSSAILVPYGGHSTRMLITNHIVAEGARVSVLIRLWPHSTLCLQAVCTLVDEEPNPRCHLIQETPPHLRRKALDHVGKKAIDQLSRCDVLW